MHPECFSINDLAKVHFLLKKNRRAVIFIQQNHYL
jgi:hypothetical protein